MQFTLPSTIPLSPGDNIPDNMQQIYTQKSSINTEFKLASSMGGERTPYVRTAASLRDIRPPPPSGQ